MARAADIQRRQRAGDRRRTDIGRLEPRPARRQVKRAFERSPRAAGAVVDLQLDGQREVNDLGGGELELPTTAAGQGQRAGAAKRAEKRLGRRIEIDVFDLEFARIWARQHEPAVPDHEPIQRQTFGQPGEFRARRRYRTIGAERNCDRRSFKVDFSETDLPAGQTAERQFETRALGAKPRPAILCRIADRNRASAR